MPNAAKLTAAVGLAVLGVVLSVIVMGQFEEDTNFGYFVHVNVAIGLAVGWVFIGTRAGRGTTSAINVGFTGSVLLILWGLFLQACYKMFDLSMKGRIDSVSEALIEVMEIMAEWALLMSTVPFWASVAIGGALVGICAEMAWRVWK
ncbi:MAG: TrgA family protein [Pseudomonadota bacterium]